MEAREGEGRAPNRGPTSWTARIVAPLALAIAAAALDRGDQRLASPFRTTTTRTTAGRRPRTPASRTPSRPSRTATTWSRWRGPEHRRRPDLHPDRATRAAQPEPRSAADPGRVTASTCASRGARRWPRAASAAARPGDGRGPAAVLALALATAPAAAAAPPPAPELPARAWVLVDAGDGEVLAKRRPASSYPVASTTKLMTAYRRSRASSASSRRWSRRHMCASTAESLLGLRRASGSRSGTSSTA